MNTCIAPVPVIPTVTKVTVYSNPPVVYQIDPNTENLKPADPTRSCVAYSQSGNGAMFGWSTVTQTWV